MIDEIFSKVTRFASKSHLASCCCLFVDAIFYGNGGVFYEVSLAMSDEIDEIVDVIIVREIVCSGSNRHK